MKLQLRLRPKAEPHFECKERLGKVRVLRRRAHRVFSWSPVCCSENPQALKTYDYNLACHVNDSES